MINTKKCTCTEPNLPSFIITFRRMCSTHVINVRTAVVLSDYMRTCSLVTLLQKDCNPNKTAVISKIFICLYAYSGLHLPPRVCVLSADTDAPQPCDEALVESKIF